MGAGGMGEVYRARDTRLDRQVAIKILSRELSADSAVKERFEREARAISQLAHPHICTLFDIGHHEGTDYLVMEFLEGETLADRIKRGPLSLADVLEYGAQIADALDRAHRQGIVHRDLKPGNVMLTRTGAKLLDFGLAKLSARHQQPLGALTNFPTEQKNLTQEGTILGTFQYMAPEQLEGLEADARTDIFAFGAVLYEMTTGRKAFDGKTKTSLIAAIVDREPPAIGTLQPLTPPALEYLIRKCLEKDPDRRWQSAADIATQLRWISEGGSLVGVAAPVVVRRKHRERAAWALALLALATTAAFGALWWREANRPRLRAELALQAPEGHLFAFEGRGENVAVSPDGTKVAFAARPEGGRTRLFIRPLRTSAAQPLAGTEGAAAAFWSPDGRYIAFFADGKLKKVDTTGGPPQTLCEASGTGGYRGGTWNRDNAIVFSPAARDPLYRINASGGTRTVLTKLDASKFEFSHRYPFFLPDGTHFLFLARSGENVGTIMVGSLDGKPAKALLQADSPALYAEPGYLLYVRDRVLMAQKFDAGSHELAPEARPVAENVVYYPSAAMAVVSTGGRVLAYQQGLGTTETELGWIDRSGKPIAGIGVPLQYRSMSLSHDGKRLAVTIRDPQQGNDDVWIYDLVRGTTTRLTFEPLIDDTPLWSPDDSEIIFSSEQKNRATRDILVKKSSGEGTATAILHDASLKWPQDVSPDGNWILYDTMSMQTNSGIDLAAVSRRDGKIFRIAATPFDERQGRFSPDGKWIAYVSNETGRPEVYVRRWPGGDGKWQVSVGGGFSPRWRGDGRELYFHSDGNRIQSVAVNPGATFDASPPMLLFQTPLTVPGSWLASADGQRFLVNRPIREVTPAPLTVLVNWDQGL